MARSLRTVALAVFTLGVAVLPAAAWMRRFAGSATIVNDTAIATAVDSRDVVVVSQSEGDLGGCRATARKRRGKTGRIVWERAVGKCDYPTSSVAIDAKNDVILGLAGFALVKLDGKTGEQLWRTELEEGAPWGSGFVSALAIDKTGDVIAAGTGIFNPHDDEDRDFAVEKLRGTTGELVWRFRIDGELAPCPPDDENCHNDQGPSASANAVAVDAAGRVFAVGGVETPTGSELTVVALDGSDGAERWRHARSATPSLPGYSYGTSVLATPSAIYAGGYQIPNGSALVVRLDAANGHERWVRSLDGNTQAIGAVRALALHRTGDVLAAGTGPGAGAGHVFAARVSPDGDVAWRWRRDVPLTLPVPSGVPWLSLASGADGTVTLLTSERTAGFDPQASEIRSHVTHLEGDDGTVRWDVPFGEDAAQPAQGTALAMVDDDLVAVGAIRAADTSLDATVARLRGADGAVDWRATEGGPSAGEDEGSGVATDAAGDLFVVGSLQNAYLAGHYNLAVLKLERRTGAEIWRREIDGKSQYFQGAFDQGFDVAVDSTGNAIAAGSVDNGVYDFDAAVVKLDGATGAERWRTLLHAGEVHDRDYGLRVLADASDRAVALVQLSDSLGRGIHHVVSLDGATGAERWRRAVDPSASVGVAGMVRGADGSIVAAGITEDAVAQRFDTVVVAWDPDSGSELWRSRLPGVQPSAVTVDARGRVAVGGSVSPSTSALDAVVVLLDAGSGTEIRRTLLGDPASRPSYVLELAADITGGLVAAGVDKRGAFAAMVTEAGDTKWRRTLVTSTAFLSVNGIEITAGGAVVTAINVGGYPAADAVLVGLAGRSGAERWRRTIDGDATPDDVDVMRDLVLTPQGDAVAVGFTEWQDTGRDLTVVQMRARTGRARGLVGTLEARGSARGR
jgi:outer membrane protein assembly factor BamB